MRIANPHMLLSLQLHAKGLPKPQHEYRFHPKRRWRLDAAWPDYFIAVECHGGVFRQGRHTRGTGFTADREKVNAATEEGWAVYEYTSAQIESGQAVRQLERVFSARGWKRQAA